MNAKGINNWRDVLKNYPVDDLLRKLTPREEDVIKLRLEGLSAAEVGNKFIVSRERIRQIEDNAFIKLLRLMS